MDRRTVMLALASSLASTGCLNFQSASGTTPTPEVDFESTPQQSPQPQTTATPATNELRSRISWETSLDMNPSLIDYQAKIGDKIIITNVRGEAQALNKSDGSSAWSVSIPNYSNATNIDQLDGMVIANNWGGGGSKIHAYDIETGTKQLTLPDGHIRPVADAETLYYGQDSPDDSETKEIVAQQRGTGDIQWRTEIPYARGSVQGQEVIETEDSIFVPSVEKLSSDQSSDISQERVYEISKSSGEKLWSQNFRKIEMAPSNNDVYIGANPYDKEAGILIIHVGNEKTVCFDHNSYEKKWEIDGNGYPQGVFGSTAVFEFLIDNRLVGIEINTGERLWTKPKSTFFDWYSDNIIVYYNEGTVFSVDGQVGSEIWRESVVNELTAWSKYSAPADVMSDSHFWLASEKRLIGFRPNGDMILDQEWELDGNISEIIAGQNRIFVSTDEGVWRALLIE